MRRLLVTAALALVAVVFASGEASAQTLDNRVVDTNKLIVQPADSAVNIVSGTVKYLNRAVADTVASNGFVRTLDNLLGRRPGSAATTQPGGLPQPGLYPSTKYPNSFQPAYPTVMQFGTSVPVKPR